MYDTIKSRFLYNIGVFFIGLILAFLGFVFFQNSTLMTANIGDAFSDTNSIVSADFSLDTKDDLFSITTLQDIAGGSGKSLRISILHNDMFPKNSINMITSLYKFSLIEQEHGFVIVIDLGDQTLVSGKELLHFPLGGMIDSKYLPIIDSLQLFDLDGVNSLSFQNTSSLLDHH